MSMKYNILWITLDSVKATALPAYGNPYTIAPNAERVARNGVTVEYAFNQMPKCVPVRPSQLAGRYPHVDGLRAIRGKIGAGDYHDLFVLTEGMPNIVTCLKERGYTTCAKGPNHLVSPDVYETWFDVTMDWEPAKLMSNPPVTCEDPEWRRADYGGPVPDDFDVESTPDAETTRQMCAFLEGHDASKPFFGYLDLRTPHPRYHDWKPWADSYAKMDIPVPGKAPLDAAPWVERVYRETYGLEDMAADKWQQIIRAYYSSISYTDSLVGRVLDVLEQRGLADNTIVIYTADHGDFAGEHGCVEKHDPFLYDCLTHMPLMLQLPPGFPRGVRADVMVEMIDVAPTLLDLCGFEVPRWMQARSFAPVVRGESTTHKEAVFCQGGVEQEALDRLSDAEPAVFSKYLDSMYYCKQQVILDHPEFMLRSKMVRTRTRKYIYRLNGHHEFYDLEKDPGELKNEIANRAYRADIDALRELLIRWMIESETNLPLIDQVWA